MTIATPNLPAPYTYDSTVAPVVDIVIPVYNEEPDLAASVHRLHAYLTEYLPYTFRITIADNASTDATPTIANQLAGELPAVVSVRIDAKGRGRALRHVWLRSEAMVLAYLDVDLSTDLAALLPLIAPLVSGHSDLAIGSACAPTKWPSTGSTTPPARSTSWPPPSPT